MAAGELGITRSAVSHQIKLLEDRLAVQLFRRDARKAELTQIGQTYYPTVRDAFDQIEIQTKALRPANTDNELTIQVYVTVALKWLIPRLADFERKYPDVKVRLSTSYNFNHWDFDQTNGDVGFILARQKLPDHYYRPLFKSYLVPICAPSLNVKTMDDIKKHKLIDVYTAEEDWQIWLEGAGVKSMKPASRLSVDSYILAQEAAAEGRG